MYEYELTFGELKVILSEMIVELEEILKSPEYNISPYVDGLYRARDCARILYNDLGRHLGRESYYSPIRSLQHASHYYDIKLGLLYLFARELNNTFDRIPTPTFDRNPFYSKNYYTLAKVFVIACALVYALDPYPYRPSFYRSDNRDFYHDNDLHLDREIVRYVVKHGSSSYGLKSAQNRVRQFIHAFERALDAILFYLDVAAPEQVFLERVFDIAAAIRLPNSPLLEAEGLTKVRSGDAQIIWTEGETRAHLRLQVTAPECQIVGTDHHTFLLVKGQESVIFYFQLIPQQIGDITVIVTLYEEHYTLGNTRVRTTVVEHIAGEVQIKVASQSVRINNYNITVQEGGKLQAGVIGSDAKVEDGVNFESED